MRDLTLWLLLLRGAAPLLLHPAPRAAAALSVRRTAAIQATQVSELPTSPGALHSRGSPKAYAAHWEDLLKREHREAAEELRERRSKWSRGRLEASGLAIFDATASPESDLFGEKVVRVCKEGATRLADRFSRGDILVIGPDRAGSPSWSSAASHFAPRECVVISTGKDWLTVGVGRTWPRGLWEARRRPGSFGVMLERAVPQASLKAQQESLYLTRMGLAGGAAALLTSDAADLPLVASRSPPWLTLAEAAGGNPSSVFAAEAAAERPREQTLRWQTHD